MREQVLQSPDVIINPYRFAGVGNGFRTGLLHWWDLDETSGNAIADAGGVDLTDTNTVTYTAGGAPDGGNCRKFTRTNSERFSASAGSVWGSGTTMSFAFWFKSTAPGITNGICGHQAPNGNTRVLITGGNLPQFYFDGTLAATGGSSVGTGWHSMVITSTGPGGTDTWYMDGSSPGTVTSRGWEPGSAIFYMGADANGATYYDGELCSFGIWNRVLTSDEATTFHNSGVNLRYAGLTS